MFYIFCVGFSQPDFLFYLFFDEFCSTLLLQLSSATRVYVLHSIHSIYLLLMRLCFTLFYLLLPISFTFIINPAISSMNVIDLMNHCSSLFTIVHNVHAAVVCFYHLCRQLIVKPSMDTNRFSVSMCYTANTNFWKVNARKPMNIEISRFAILCALAPCIF